MRRVSLYLLILILMPSICFGLNIDTNSNDYVDVPYGGSDAGTFTDGGILIGAGTAAFEATAVGAAGEILVGVAAANPKWLTAGTATYWLVAAGAADPVWTDPAGLTAGIATLATTVTLTDNEATNETNPIWFSAGAAGSGSVGPEADGDLYYNPSTGYLTAPNFAGTTYGSDGSVSDAELLYNNSLTENVQTALTAAARFADAEAISGNWEVQDGVHFSFGNDDDASWAWDAAAVRLELRNVSDTPIFWFDLANYSIGVAATATPEIGMYDSGATGTARTDEYAGGLGADITDGTEDAVISDVFVYYMDTTKKTALTVDGSANQINTTLPVSAGSLTPVTGHAADFAAEFTGANLYGGTFVCSEAGTIQLPVMGVGMNFTVITLGALAVVIDTNGADGYLHNGVTNAEGKNLTNLSTAGDIAVVQYYTADDWLITTNGWTPEA